MDLGAVFLFVAVCGLTVAALHAGNIVGRAFDVNTGSYLPGVAIEVVGLNITAVSDPDGRYSNEWLQIGGWNQRTIGGTTLFLPSSFEMKPERGQHQRMGATLNLEYRPGAETQLYLRSNFSNTDRFGDTHEIIHSVDNSVARTTLTSPTGGVFAGAGVRTERREFHERRQQDLFNLSGGFKRVVGPFTLEGVMSVSQATEDRPYTDVLAFRNASGGTGPVTFDIGTFDFLRYGPSHSYLMRTSRLLDRDYKIGINVNY